MDLTRLTMDSSFHKMSTRYDTPKKKEQHRIWQNRWLKKNPEYESRQSKRYYQTNREKILEKRVEYRKNNPDYMKQWCKNNPKKRLKSMQKYFLKAFGKDAKSIRWYLHYWSKAIFKRDSSRCQICGEPAVDSHHILFKKHYPQLALLVNNGIALCDIHHAEVHGRFS